MFKELDYKLDCLVMSGIDTTRSVIFMNTAAIELMRMSLYFFTFHSAPDILKADKSFGRYKGFPIYVFDGGEGPQFYIGVRV